MPQPATAKPPKTAAARPARPARPKKRRPAPSAALGVGSPQQQQQPVQGCTHLKLRQLGRTVSRHYEAHLAGSGLRITQYSLLSAVVKLGPVGLGKLASVLRLDGSTLSRNLQPLVDQGLVDVHAGEADARSRVARATPAGQALRAEAQRAWKQAQLALNQRLGVERVAALHGLIGESLALLEAPHEEGEHD